MAERGSPARGCWNGFPSGTICQDTALSRTNIDFDLGRNLVSVG